MAAVLALLGCEESRPVTLPPKDPAQLDREALEDLAQSGGDPNAPQSLRHVLLFPTQEAAQKAIPALELLGYSVSLHRIRAKPDHPEFMIHASATAVPTLDHLQRTRASLAQLTQRVGGRYDGWELILSPTTGTDGGR